MIPVSMPAFVGNEKKYLIDCIDSGWVSSKGKYIEKFEKGFANYCGVKYASSCSNGTTALHLALEAIGIKEGDEVILPNLTFISPANAVRYCGATPVFVDSDEKSWNIDVSEIKKKITKKTKAIIAVHLYGKPCEMDELLEICKENNLYLIEDCAEAHGAEYNKKRVGSFGDVSCFSFYGNKIITTGEGGMCLTNDVNILEKINELKNHGMSKTKKYWHEVIGYNYRMTNVCAAIGLAQLEKIDKFIEKRRKDAKIYEEELSGIKNICFQTEEKNCKNVHWLYSILYGKKREERDKLLKFLYNKDIETRPFFYPIADMPIYATKESFPVSERLSATGLSLPTFYDLDVEQIKYICKKIKEFDRSR